MANMGRSLSLYALLVIAIVMSTATTTATTTTEDPSAVYTQVVTITADTEATLTPSPLTTSTGTDDGTSTTDEVTDTAEMTTSNMDTATSNTNPPSSPSSSFSLSTASGTVTTSDSAGSTDEETFTSPSNTTGESTTVMITYSMKTAASNTNPSSSPTSSLSLSTETEIVSETESTVGTSPSSIISTEAATMTPSGSYTAGYTTEALSSSSSIASTTARTEPTTELSTIATTNSSTESLTDPPIEPRTDPPTEPPSEPRTDPRTEPTTEPKVGPVPEPTFPKLDETAEKTYQFEFAVDESTTANCTSTNLRSVACNIFKHNITQELEAVYGQSAAFVRVEVVLRAGSVIVNHNVTYSYNDMTPDQRMASAQDIYDETLGKEVADGNFGNYTVIYCETCATPKETSTICDFPERDIDCQSEYSKPTCKDNYWVCESICDTTYCNGNGICWQRDDLDTKPICSCDWDDDHWYWGYSCQFYVNETFLIIGCSCSGAVLIVLLASLIAYVCVKSSDKSDKATSSSENGDDVIHAFRNLAYDHGTETVFRPVDDIDYLDDGEIVQQKRPFSYTDTKGENYTTIDSSGIIRNQNGGGQRDSRMAVNEDAAKRQSNGSATDYRHSSFMKSNGTSQQRDPDFWGNLNEHVVEQIKLEPVLDHIDVNESFRIQRPRISPNYSFSNTIASPNSNAYQNMDSAQNQYIPEADYAQR